MKAATVDQTLLTLTAAPPPSVLSRSDGDKMGKSPQTGGVKLQNGHTLSAVSSTPLLIQLKPLRHDTAELVPAVDRVVRN